MFLVFAETRGLSLPWLAERPLQSPSRRPDSKPGTSMMLLNWLPPRQAGNDIGEILTTCISHFNPEIIWALEHTGRLIMAAPVVSTSNQIPGLQNDRIQLPPGWCRRPNSSGPRDSRGSQHLAPSLIARPPRPFRVCLATASRLGAGGTPSATKHWIRNQTACGQNTCAACSPTTSCPRTGTLPRPLLTRAQR